MIHTVATYDTHYIATYDTHYIATYDTQCFLLFWLNFQVCAAFIANVIKFFEARFDGSITTYDTSNWWYCCVKQQKIIFLFDESIFIFLD